MGGAGYFVANNVYSRLVVSEVGGAAPYPDLADHFESLDGARRWHFHLRRDARWQDGHPLTAHDAAYTHSHAIARGYQAASYLEGVNEVVALDDHTVEYRLSEPDAALPVKLGNLAPIHLLARHVYDGTDWATNPANQHPVGSGPFRFVEHVPGERIVLERWPDYWGPPAGVDRVTLVVEPDLDECVRMVADGRADYAPQDVLIKRRLPLAEGSTVAHVRRERGPGVAILGFNYRRAVFQDPRVRHAVARAVDRDRLQRFAEPGWSQPWPHYFPATSMAHDSQLVAPGHDPATAERLLDEAGLGRGADGVRARWRILHLAAFDGHGGLVASVAEDLAAVGIVCDAAGLDSVTWTEHVALRHDFDLTVTGGNMLPDPDLTSSRFATGGGRNILGLANPDADACYAAARATTDRAERIEHYRQLQRVWTRDASIVPLFWYCVYLLRSDRFVGWSDDLDFRVPYWHWGRLHAR